MTVWNVKSSTPVPTPHLPYDHQNPKHTYSASTWMYFEGIDKHALIVGNMAGDIFIWTWDRTQNVISCLILSDFLTDDLKAFREVATQLVCHNANNQVMSMDVADARVSLGSRGRIVTSTADRTVAVWSLSSNFELSNIFMADLQKDILPRTVKFARGTDNIFVFSKLGGSLCVPILHFFSALIGLDLAFNYMVRVDSCYGPRKMARKKCAYPDLSSHCHFDIYIGLTSFVGIVYRSTK